jgi:hypothetical protein
VTLTVTDADGGITTETGEILITNTMKGEVYVREYWDNGHRLEGDVTILPGGGVTVVSDALIEVEENPGGTTWADQYGLHVQGDLVMESGSGFRPVTGFAGYWEGILLYNTFTLEGASVKGAWRGGVISPSANGTVNDMTFENNFIGLHILKDGQEVTDSRFLDNPYCGVKEEPGVIPVMINNLLEGSKFNYFSPERPEFTIELLNLRTGNERNR